MKVVIAPDSFKESMTAFQVAQAIEKGIRNVMENAQIIKMPLADGGEGTFDVLTYHLQAKTMTKEVTGPLGKKLHANYGLTEDGTAIIEIASAAGLHHLQREERNPIYTTTYGVGELIIDALDHGANHFIIGLGGSATNDGGIGMLQALGVKMIDQNGHDVAFGGKGLAQIEQIIPSTMDERLNKCTFTIASDVSNPLLGEHGATKVYGPQKGATEAMLKKLEAAMERYAQLLERDVKKSIAQQQGAGAAGGLGAAFLAFLNAEMKSGIDLIMDIANIEEAIQSADLVITGEGKIDDQTMFGKVPIGVAKIAKKYRLPVIVFTGANHVTSSAIYEAGIDAIFPIVDGPMELSVALTKGDKLLTKSVENVFRLVTSTSS